MRVDATQNPSALGPGQLEVGMTERGWLVLVRARGISRVFLGPRLEELRLVHECGPRARAVIDGRQIHVQAADPARPTTLPLDAPEIDAVVDDASEPPEGSPSTFTLYARDARFDELESDVGDGLLSRPSTRRPPFRGGDRAVWVRDERWNLDMGLLTIARGEEVIDQVNVAVSRSTTEVGADGLLWASPSGGFDRPRVVAIDRRGDVVEDFRFPEPVLVTPLRAAGDAILAVVETGYEAALYRMSRGVEPEMVERVERPRSLRILSSSGTAAVLAEVELVVLTTTTQYVGASGRLVGKNQMQVPRTERLRVVHLPPLQAVSASPRRSRPSLRDPVSRLPIDGDLLAKIGDMNVSTIQDLMADRLARHELQPAERLSLEYAVARYERHVADPATPLRPIASQYLEPTATLELPERLEQAIAASAPLVGDVVQRTRFEWGKTKCQHSPEAA